MQQNDTLSSNMKWIEYPKTLY